MDKPIRVLHVIGIMNRGGAETMIMNLYRHIDRSKVQFDFVENSSEPAIFDEEIISLGGRIYRCPHYNGKNHFTYAKWWNEFFQAHSKEYPIVHRKLHFTNADGTTNAVGCPHLNTDIMERYGLVRNGQEQTVAGIHVYPADFFNPLDSVTGDNSGSC